MAQRKSFLVVTPHPDDAEGAAGGTIARWIDEGYEAVYVVCTNGDKGSNDPEMTSERLAKLREQEQREAARLLGVKELIFLGHPDGFLPQSTPFLEQVTRAIRQYRPEKVMTCDPYIQYVAHHDHRVAGMVVLEAVFPVARDHLYFPEHKAAGLLPYRVSEVYLWGSSEPNEFTDITRTMERKLDAILCHQSQVGHHPQMVLRQRFKERSRMIGEPHKMALAESFHRIEFG